MTIVVGLVSALLRFSDSLVGRVMARCYLEVIRNTPLLVQLYLYYFCIAPILGIERYWTAVLTLAIFEGAFASEIFRAAILSVDKGQWKAAFGLGLSQAFRLILPPMTGQAVSLIKHSAIVSVIAVLELTTEGRNIIADTFLLHHQIIPLAGWWCAIFAFSEMRRPPTPETAPGSAESTNRGRLASVGENLAQE